MEPLEGELVTSGELMDGVEGVSAHLQSQHPLHALLGRTYERMGGDDWFVGWCEEHESAFVKLLFTATPAIQPVRGVQGEVHLHVHNTLGPTALDG